MSSLLFWAGEQRLQAVRVLDTRRSLDGLCGLRHPTERKLATTVRMHDSNDFTTYDHTIYGSHGIHSGIHGGSF